MFHAYTRSPDERIAWLRNLPFIMVHLAPLASFWTGVTPRALWLCAGLYVARMFFITAGYHRYFSHRAYKMGRIMQFLMAVGGASAAQKGPLWWAAHHRHHHKFSDTPEDVHSPLKGFFWSHMGWVMCNKYTATNFDAVKDLANFPELRWLNRYHLLPPILLACACFWFAGWSGLVIGFFLSTVITWHCTYFINSLAHVFGQRRYVTSDTSRNSLLLALLTLGEGWHNNHHYYQSTANQGFFAWEIDISYYVLRVLAAIGLVYDLRTPPQHVLDANRLADGHPDLGMFEAKLAGAIAALGVTQVGSSQAVDELRDSTRRAAQRVVDILETSAQHDGKGATATSAGS